MTTIETGTPPEIKAPEIKDPVETKAKSPFVRPRLVWYGSVVELTNQFGGSLTPDEREVRGLEP